MLLEAIEKLLALLIIMAMLILVMFLALPDSGKVGTKAERPEIESAPRERYVERASEPAADKPGGETAPAGNGKANVPNPPGAPAQPQSAQDTTSPPKQDNGTNGTKLTQAAKQPKRQDRLPFAKSEPLPTVRTAKEKIKLRTETVIARQPAPPRYVEYRTEESRVYVKPEKRRSRWDRTHYYECDGGRCDCSCTQPYYWARSGPCWD